MDKMPPTTASADDATKEVLIRLKDELNRAMEGYNQKFEGITGHYESKFCALLRTFHDAECEDEGNVIALHKKYAPVDKKVGEFFDGDALNTRAFVEHILGELQKIEHINQEHARLILLTNKRSSTMKKKVDQECCELGFHLRIVQSQSHHLRSILELENSKVDNLNKNVNSMHSDVSGLCDALRSDVHFNCTKMKDDIDEARAVMHDIVSDYVTGSSEKFDEIHKCTSSHHTGLRQMTDNLQQVNCTVHGLKKENDSLRSEVTDLKAIVQRLELNSNRTSAKLTTNAGWLHEETGTLSARIAKIEKQLSAPAVHWKDQPYEEEAARKLALKES